MISGIGADIVAIGRIRRALERHGDRFTRRILSDAELAVASHGVRLDGEEQRRRWVMLGLLESGLDAASYASRFGAHPAVDLPELGEVVDLGLGDWHGDVLRLNADGRAASDVLGQWLQSAQVAALRADYVPV